MGGMLKYRSRPIDMHLRLDCNFWPLRMREGEMHILKSFYFSYIGSKVLASLEIGFGVALTVVSLLLSIAIVKVIILVISV